MNRLFILLTILVFSPQLFSQSEFATNKNGLIYSDETMKKLERIVDSLNLQFITCETDKVFHSKLQTIAHMIRLDSIDVKQAKMDIDNNISYGAFKLKYAQSQITENVLMIKSKYQNYKDEFVVSYRNVELNGGYGLSVDIKNQQGQFKKKMKNTWLYNHYEKSDYSEAILQAFFFPNEFESITIPSKYSDRIGYSDCLIDTTTTKFKEDAEYGMLTELPDNWKGMPKFKKVELLNDMRATKVRGSCSQDSRPREHAMRIALLAAETTNWEVFLKSHLDIMNDRFERVSDGSYAWQRRNTYIKEIEELNINVTDLLLGISLRIEDPATNHYFGSVGRIGRAISESVNKLHFEREMLSMIEDSNLDNYNRVLAYFLFVSYNNYLDDEELQKNNLLRLKKSIATLPSYLHEKIKLKER